MKLYDPDLVDILDDEMREQIEKDIEGEPEGSYSFSLRWQLFWDNLDLFQGQWTRTLLGLFYIYIALSIFGRSRTFFDLIIIIFFAPQYPEYNRVLVDMKCLFLYGTAVKVLFYLNRGMIFFFYGIRLLF